MNMGNGKVKINIDSKASKLIFIMITLIATPIHELGHLLGYQLTGIPAKYSFISVESMNGSESLLACLGGPTIGLLLALLGLITVYVFKARKYIYFCLYFTITMCLNRLIPYLLMIIIHNIKMFQINDEGLIGTMLNIPILQVYVFFMIVFISILLILKSVQKKYFNKCFKYAFVLNLLIMVLFQIKII